MLTSSHSFEGYNITDYCGFISSETALGLGFIKSIAASVANFTGVESESLNNRLSSAKEASLSDLKKQAVALKANAIIGMSLDYAMFGDSMVAVIVAGTAVKIEKTV